MEKQNFHQIQALSFDCYGTLIDWETGILAALMPFLKSKGFEPQAEEVLSLYAEFEPLAEKGEFKIYRSVLRAVMQSYAEHFGFELRDEEAKLLENSIQNWPAFPDTVEALQKLSQNYRLCIISNIDEDLIRQTLPHLKQDFDAIITAEQVGAYKPSTENLEAALAQLELKKENLLHCAQSLYHDISPANKLGIPNCWVNRRKGKSGSGATPLSSAQANHEVLNLAELATLLT